MRPAAIDQGWSARRNSNLPNASIGPPAPPTHLKAVEAREDRNPLLDDSDLIDIPPGVFVVNVPVKAVEFSIVLVVKAQSHSLAGVGGQLYSRPIPHWGVRSQGPQHNPARPGAGGRVVGL